MVANAIFVVTETPAAPTPEVKWGWLNRQQSESEQTIGQRQNGIGQQQPKSEFIDRFPFMNGLCAKGCDYADKTSQRYRKGKCCG